MLIFLKIMLKVVQAVFSEVQSITEKNVMNN